MKPDNYSTQKMLKNSMKNGLQSVSKSLDDFVPCCTTTILQITLNFCGRLLLNLNPVYIRWILFTLFPNLSKMRNEKERNFLSCLPLLSYPYAWLQSPPPPAKYARYFPTVPLPFGRLSLPEPSRWRLPRPQRPDGRRYIGAASASLCSRTSKLGEQNHAKKNRHCGQTGNLDAVACHNPLGDTAPRTSCRKRR